MSEHRWPFCVPCCSGPEFEQVLRSLTESASGLDDAAALWPADQFSRLAHAGILGWTIPIEFGGGEVDAGDILAGYVRLAAACLTTTFILTQRNGACQRIAASDNETLKSELLPTLARGETFATVGISHLTTSRQHWTAPSVRAEPIPGGFRLDGEIPWVTGATQAQVIVTGGTLSDGRQVLAAIPADARGVAALPPVRLVALSSSQTGAVRLDEVEVPDRRVLFGPVEKVMQQGAGGSAGSLGTSALAAGLSLTAIAGIEAEAQHRPDLAEAAGPLRAEWDGLCGDLQTAANDSLAGSNPLLSTSVRTRANSLVLRATQAWLAASKGAGYVAGHPAGRAAREALFFLVWSCPQPVVNAALRELTCRNTE